MYDKERVDHLLQQDKTPEVIDELVRRNAGLVYNQLKKFGLVGDPEALSLGYESLYKAIVGFEPGRHKFSTYATVCIYNRLGSYVRSLNTWLELNTFSYHNNIDEEGHTMLDYFESNDKADEPILDRCGVSNIHRAAGQALKEFTNPLQHKILKAWIDSEYTLTRDDLASTVGCSQPYVTQVIKKFRSILKKKLEELQ